MVNNIQEFKNFKVGDYVVFERQFSQEEFANFSSLSGDRNPLHHNAKHAAFTPFKVPIVPLHMTMSPLSMIAGMVFPGEPSLYLGHEIRAAQPVYYGEKITYSARLTAINAAQRILSIRVLAIRETEVVLDAVMRVQAQEEQWQTPSNLPIKHLDDLETALILGGSGDIGGAIAARLAQKGWNLLLQDRGNKERRQHLKEMLTRIAPEVSVEFIEADLAISDKRKCLLDQVSNMDELSLVVHTASPPVDAELTDLVEVNFAALKEISQAILPHFLRQQAGKIVFVSSISTQRTIPGWENYSAAKAMASNYMYSLKRTFSFYGIRSLIVMPGLVDTRFSQDFKEDQEALSPQEVAEIIVEETLNATDDRGTLKIEMSGSEFGEIGFHSVVKSSKPLQKRQSMVSDSNVSASDESKDDIFDTIALVVRKKLKMSPQSDLSSAALGVTAGWDSLAHIEIVLEIENAINVRFTSFEIEKLYTFQSMMAICEEKLQNTGKS